MPTALKGAPDRELAERLLKESLELDLITTGRKTGKARTVELWFVYEDGLVWFLSEKDGNGPTTHWARNLLVNPEASLKIGRVVYRARSTRLEDSERQVPLLLDAYREKYGHATVSQYYGGRPRMPFALRITWPRSR